MATRLAVVGTDLKFIRPLIDRLETSGLFEVRVDEWPKFRAHDRDVTEEMLDWAEVVVCEWAGPNAVLAGKAKRDDQRLVVRLHRMELSHPEWREIDISAVDLVVTVGPYYRRKVLETTGWPPEKIMVVPNSVDVADLDRPKREGAIRSIGMLGFSSSRKRLDRALDVLAELRKSDEAFHLFLKGSSPWGLKWVDDRPEEVEFFERVRRRLDTDPLLEGATSFDPEGPDIGSWLEKIGFVLSTSDDESFHLSPAEGMASRAVPAILPWPGADEIYDRHWILEDESVIAERMLELSRSDEAWRAAGDRAHDEVASHYSLEDVAAMWIEHVLLPGSRWRPEGMEIDIVSGRNATADPSIRALAYSLDAVGHRVRILSRGDAVAPVNTDVEIRRIDPPTTRFSWRWWKRRLGLTGNGPAQVADTELEAAGNERRPDLVYPHREEDIDIAGRMGAPVARMPGWPAPARDLVSLAPHDRSLSISPATPPGEGAGSTEWPAYEPEAERFSGRRAVVAYRVTPTSPGRYLEAALRRAGVEVTVMDGVLDWTAVPENTDLVVVVESPYPALDISGRKPGVPTFFWVHHGEHHLAANIRLAHRYQADAVLMAHSWHLAHRFPVPTYRFPFGVAPELAKGGRTWSLRRHDVAMVGAGIGGSGGRYDRRRQLVDELEAADGIQTAFAYGLQPQEMVELYGDARIVVNEVGPRHFPITMRVFEALGAGALLLTEEVAGTDTLLRPGDHYLPMEDDLPAQIRHLLANDRSAGIADAGRSWATSRHSYDHRVDRLVHLADQTRARSLGGRFAPLTPLAHLIDQDVEVQQIAVFGDVTPLGLSDRAVRIGDTERLSERSIDAVVIGRGRIEDLRGAVLAARGYVYSDQPHAAEVERLLEGDRPEARVTTHAGLLRADLGGTAYAMRPADHPLSG